MTDDFRRFIRSLFVSQYERVTKEIPQCKNRIIVEQTEGGFFGPYQPEYLCPTNKELMKFIELGKKGTRDHNHQTNRVGVEFVYTLIDPTE